MKTDFYTKSILTVIAFCLCLIVLGNIDIIPSAYANPASIAGENKQEYFLVPLNADGSINVNIKTVSGVMDVNIEEVGGYATYGTVPVEIQ